ncbi:MAG: hypothetical protein HYW33_01970 [Candidatus Blackburnbacteria bacterium]|nr:hypothetical protein [Candidatus Blackburnbacteria bacterium]
MKIVFILVVLALLSLPVKVFGQTPITEPIYKSIPLPVTTTKPISSTSPQQTPTTKPVDPELIDESYCHGFDSQSCPSSRCQLVSSCPVCLNIGTCHAKGYHKWGGKNYEPPLYPETKTRKIEIKPTDGIKKIEIIDDKGITKTVEPEKLNEVVISPDPEKCKPKPCSVLTLKIENGETVINSDGVITKTSLPVKIEENKITIETKDQNVEVLNPSKVKEKLESYTKAQSDTLTITSTSLDSCNLQGDDESLCRGVSSVYTIDTIRQIKFLGFLPVKPKVKYTLNASSGDTISEDSPWYLKTLPFLFK